MPPVGRVGEEAKQALKAGGVKVADPVLHQLVAFSHSANDGRTAQELDPGSKAAAEIGELFNWMAKQANLQTRLSAKEQTPKKGVRSVLRKIAPRW